MKFTSILSIASLLGVFGVAEAAYDANGKNNAAYWGQGTGQESLGTYCSKGDIDIVVVSFLKDFSAKAANFNFGNACGGNTCPQIETDIKSCQAAGIKVLLSLGGDSRYGKYGVSSDKDGVSAANVIYNMFHPSGTGKVKPFGTAEIDGFDFDIENGKQTGLGALVAQLRKAWTTKTLIISAAPQCPYPDSNVYKLLQSTDAKVDIAWVQFYNNPACAFNNAEGFAKSWQTWYNFATQQSGNTNMKVYIGLASSTEDAAYFVDAATTKERSASAMTQSAFGGFCLWDVSSGTEKVSGGQTYVQSLKNILTGSAVTKRSIDGSSKSFQIITPN